MIEILVLGAAAGGGFPQWNCACESCARARAGDPAAHHATQASLAVSVGDGHWFLLNASPDLGRQISMNAVLQPAGTLRGSPIVGVVLTSAEVDAVAGLLTMRERHAFSLNATADVLGLLNANPMFDVLSPELVPRQAMPLEQRRALADGSGRATRIYAELFSVPGKVPLYLEGVDPSRDAEIGDGSAVGLAVDDGMGHRIYFVPGCAAMTPALANRLRGADLVFFDGTLLRDDEMIRAGLSDKTARRMGHMAVDGADGVIAAFDGLDVRRKIFIHMNNSNPLLLRDSIERRIAETAGWQVAQDGMEVRLG